MTSGASRIADRIRHPVLKRRVRSYLHTLRQITPHEPEVIEGRDLVLIRYAGRQGSFELRCGEQDTITAINYETGEFCTQPVENAQLPWTAISILYRLEPVDPVLPSPLPDEAGTDRVRRFWKLKLPRIDWAMLAQLLADLLLESSARHLPDTAHLLLKRRRGRKRGW